jgi:hypothetical protein
MMDKAAVPLFLYLDAAVELPKGNLSLVDNLKYRTVWLGMG